MNKKKKYTEQTSCEEPLFNDSDIYDEDDDQVVYKKDNCGKTGDSGSVPSTLETTTTHNIRTISSFNFTDFCVKVYCYEQLLLKKKYFKDIIISERNSSFQFEYDYRKYMDIFLHSRTIVIYKEKIHTITVNGQGFLIFISGKYVEELYDILMELIKSNNPLRNKSLQMINTDMGLSYKMRNYKKVTLNNIVIDKDMKEDIRDNTLFHLEQFNDSNGIILYGPPGAGKSLICSSVMYEAIKKGYSVCWISEYVDFTNLEEFFEKMLSPCIIIIEDIDTIGGDRQNVHNNKLSSLLQMLNGLSERKEKVVFLATTNYIDLLDDALKNRPLRFNRKIKIDYPTDSQIDKLIDLYFKEEKITNENKKDVII